MASESAKEDEKVSENGGSIAFGESRAKKVWLALEKCVKNITIEPILCFWTVSTSMNGISCASLYFDKTCKSGSIWFGNGTSYPDEVCDHIDSGEYDDIQNSVQSTVADVRFVVNMCQAVPMMIFILFVGPWSDRFGRKFILLCPLVGFIYSDLIYLLGSLFEELPVEFLMLEMFKNFFGGGSCVWMAVYCYISDITSPSSRTTRIGLLDFFSFIASAIGNAISGPILISFGYVAVFAVSMLFTAMAFVYGLFVKESKVIRREKILHHYGSQEARDAAMSAENDLGKTAEEETASKWEMFKAMFSFQNAKKGISTVVKKRPWGMRHIVVILITIYAGHALAGNGLDNQYSRKKFEWESTDEFNLFWSSYGSSKSIFSLFSVGLLLPLATEVLHVSDMMLVVFSNSASLVSYITLQIAEQAQLLYLVGFFQSFSDLNTVAVRSAMTKVVGPKEVGRVFACVALSAGVVQLIKPMYEKIYSATLDWYFGFVFCISDMITIVMICLAVYVFIYMKYVERKKAAADEPAKPDTGAAETPAQNYKRIDFELTNSMLIAAYDKADGDSNGRASIATISSTVIKNLSQQQ